MSKKITTIYVEEGILNTILEQKKRGVSLSKLITDLLIQYTQMNEETTDKKILTMKLNRLTGIIEKERVNLGKLVVEQTALQDQLRQIREDEEASLIQAEEVKKAEAELKITCAICGTIFGEHDKTRLQPVKDGRFVHNNCFLNATKEKRTESTITNS